MNITAAQISQMVDCLVGETYETTVERAADALHRLISASGALASVLNGDSSAYERWKMHDAIDRIVQSANGQHPLTVIKSGNWHQNAPEVSLSDTSGDSKPYLVGVRNPQGAERFTFHPFPSYWEDGMGEHLEVFAEDAAGRFYIYRRSMTARTYYAIHILAVDFPSPSLTGRVWGYLVNPEIVKEAVFYKEDYSDEREGWARLRALNLPACPVDESEGYARARKNANAPHWTISVQPVDLGEFASRLFAMLRDATTPRPPAAAPVEKAEIEEAWDDEDDEQLLGSSTLAKLRASRLLGDG